jgi:hypothetical protein
MSSRARAVTWGDVRAGDIVQFSQSEHFWLVIFYKMIDDPTITITLINLETNKKHFIHRDYDEYLNGEIVARL